MQVALLVEISHLNADNDYEATTLSGWFTCALFLIVGAAQAGVLAAFFLLTWLDSSLLDGVLASGEHTLAEVMVWNHARYTPAFFAYAIDLMQTRCD